MACNIHNSLTENWRLSKDFHFKNVLWTVRRAAAGQLRKAVEGCLADLAMAGSRFDVRIGWEPCLPEVRLSFVLGV